MDITDTKLRVINGIAHGANFNLDLENEMDRRFFQGLFGFIRHLNTKVLIYLLPEGCNGIKNNHIVQVENYFIRRVKNLYELLSSELYHPLNRYIDAYNATIIDDEVIDRIVETEGYLKQFTLRDIVFIQEWIEENAHFDEDCMGNYILTKSKILHSLALEDMCCGVFSSKILLPSGQIAYYAFDYGH